MIFLLFILFYVGSGSLSSPGTGTVMHSGSGFAKAKSYVSSGSGSTTLVTQSFLVTHYFQNEVTSNEVAVTSNK
jgi:hypothetical protein